MISIIINPEPDGSGESFEVAPGWAWNEFGRAIEAMPDAKGKHFWLHHLVSEGVCTDPPQVAVSLEALMKANRLNESDMAVARRLHWLIKDLDAKAELLVD